MTTSYIPATDLGFQTWLNNFETQIDTEFATYGLTAPEAAAVTAVNTAYNAALLLALDPGTRTPVTVAAKNVAKATALATVRPLAQKVKANPLVSDGQRVLLGLTVDSVPPTPVPTPTSFPLLDLLNATPGVHAIQYRDSDTPTSKAKPPGAKQMELYRFVGVEPSIDPELATYIGVFTKSPLTVSQEVGDNGKTATYYARWLTQTGLVGPWSSGVSLTIAF